MTFDNVVCATDCISGRGVRARRDIPDAAVVEVCPVVVLDIAELEHVDATSLWGYYYDWDGEGALALGYGSLYNHSFTPNAAFEPDFDNNTIVVSALRPIARGEEVLIDYTGAGAVPLWFDPVEG